MCTKIFFRTLVLTLSLSTLWLTTSCGIDTRLTDEDSELAVKKGYDFPILLEVKSYANTPNYNTRASYNTETMRLRFNDGDHLLVSGTHAKAGRFAGELIWQGGVTFKGSMKTEKEFTGNAYDLLEDASTTVATLLPNDYISYGYLSISGTGCNAILGYREVEKAFADTKAHGVEQLSYVHADRYDNGFALVAGNAIMSCTITGLEAGKEYEFTATDGYKSPSGTVTSDSEGNATFTVAFTPEGARTYSIKIGDGTEYYDINIGAKAMSEGCIYTIRTAATELR